MKADKIPAGLTEPRPPIDHRGFSSTERLCKAEYLMASPSHLEHRAIDQVRRFGEHVALSMLNRGPHIVDFRYGVEWDYPERGLLSVVDTITQPVPVRYTSSPFAIITDEGLERCRPKLKRPPMSFYERMESASYSMPTKRSPPSSRASRFISALKKIAEPLPYDGPKASDKHHSI
jgi:hypothetical protein